MDESRVYLCGVIEQRLELHEVISYELRLVVSRRGQGRDGQTTDALYVKKTGCATLSWLETENSQLEWQGKAHQIGVVHEGEELDNQGSQQIVVGRGLVREGEPDCGDDR